MHTVTVSNDSASPWKSSSHKVGSWILRSQFFLGVTDSFVSTDMDTYMVGLRKWESSAECKALDSTFDAHFDIVEMYSCWSSTRMKLSEAGKKLSPEVSSKKSPKEIRGWKVPIHIVSDVKDETTRSCSCWYSLVAGENDAFSAGAALHLHTQVWLGQGPR